MKIKRTILLFTLILPFLIIEQNSAGSTKEEKRLNKSKKAAFRLLLTEEGQKTYDMITDSSARAEWENRFWKTLDPTPTTPENERYEEYLRRFDFARKHYSNIISPLYLDDRAKYYIKYGEPDDFVESMGGGVERNYRDNMTWAYYGLNLFIDFVEREFYGYQEAYDLSEAVRSTSHNVKAYIAAQLYAEREDLHPRYAHFRDIESSRDISGINEFFTEAGYIVEEKRAALAVSPPHEYHYDYKAEPLSASLKCANFRDDDQKTRVEFYYSVPLREITFVPGQTYPLESHLDKRISITNRDLKEVLNKADRLLLGAANQNQVKDNTYINQHEEILAPGLYNIALRLENPQGDRLAILKAQLLARDFSGNNLLLSDMELASQVNEKISGQRVKQNNIQVVPYLSNTVMRTTPLYVYFEIYNLNRDNEGYTHYEVNYTVQSMEGSGNRNPIAKIASFLVGGKKNQSVATSFDGSGTSDFQQIYLLMDFSTSPTGKTDFLVKVTDRVSGLEAISKVSFILK